MPRPNPWQWPDASFLAPKSILRQAFIAPFDNLAIHNPRNSNVIHLSPHSRAVSRGLYSRSVGTHGTRTLAQLTVCKYDLPPLPDHMIVVYEQCQNCIMNFVDAVLMVSSRLLRTLIMTMCFHRRHQPARAVAAIRAYDTAHPAPNPTMM
ncbi:hypothetical protein EVG20_g1327 [Dentipellis fragilis]|uniref:Uncharacterized protein n=1 Tax=Dentipellis fragilis TaxID=205917 RepID=A0A4Y9ZAW4_9AGAM|nr:hypothetical protein EVG20_g1327 [Dentipellis fragilis]